MQGKIREVPLRPEKKKIIKTNSGYTAESIYKLPTKDGDRYYTGSGSSKDLQKAANKAKFNARFKAAKNPADSTTTADFKKFKTEIVDKRKK